MNKTELLVLFGGKSSEYEVSLISAYSILSNVNKDNYNITSVGITKGGDWYLYDSDIDAIKSGDWCNNPSNLKKAMLSASPSDSALIIFDSDGTYTKKHIDVIFPVMHGANAEDGTLQGLLKLSGIPFVGCGCTTSAIGMDKGYTKLVLNNFHIPQAKCKIVLREDFNKFKDEVLYDCEAVCGSYPLFVKPANAGSSVGASKANDRSSLEAAIVLAAEHDSKILVEEYINGKEIEVAVIGNGDYVASTCGQINPGSEFYDYDAKYSADSNSSCLIPADIQWETMLGIRAYAVKICSVLGVSGLSRVDFFVSEENGSEKITFNEINTLPGFTQISMYPKLMVSDGMSYSQLIDALITLAIEKEASN